jgi:multiple sugar transport system substrate-binding protein
MPSSLQEIRHMDPNRAYSTNGASRASNNSFFQKTPYTLIAVLFSRPSLSRPKEVCLISVFLASLLLCCNMLTDDMFYVFSSFHVFLSSLRSAVKTQLNSIYLSVPDSVVLAATGTAISSNKENDTANFTADDTITLKLLLTDLGEKGRWKSLFEGGLEKLQYKYPDKHIILKYDEYPTNDTRDKFLLLMSNKTPVDIVSVDQIWLGEFASKGLLSNLTDYVDKWGRSSDWYQQHWDGGAYNGTAYGILAWTDVRGIWYWKDLLRQAQVNPENLKTWKGYVDSAKKLNQAFKSAGLNGTVLFDTYYSQDIWFPYLWMLGGDILELREGHPTKGTYWFPAYNSSDGIQALGFIRDQINAGIAPACCDLDKEFSHKRIAMMLGGSWIPGEFPNVTKQDFESKIGFIPMFPVPNLHTHSSTLMGGWELSVPITSDHKGLAWELIAEMLDPGVLGPWIQKYGYLPTQIPLGQGLILNQSTSDLPYYDTLISMIPTGKIRPSIPEYPVIAGHINEALHTVYHSNSTNANISSILNHAAAKSAHALGW